MVTSQTTALDVGNAISVKVSQGGVLSVKISGEYGVSECSK